MKHIDSVHKRICAALAAVSLAYLSAGCTPGFEALRSIQSPSGSGAHIQTLPISEMPAIDNAGSGCADGNCIWILTRHNQPSVAVEVRTVNDELIRRYADQSLSRPADGLSLALESQYERDLFGTSGLKIYLNDRGLRSIGVHIVRGSTAAIPTVPAPIIENAGTGCEDGYCLWMLVKNSSALSAIEVRTADGSGVLKVYSEFEHTFSGDSMTLALATTAERELLDTTGLRIYVAEGGQRSNGFLIQKNTPAPPPRPLYYGYFGVSNDSHLETADHTNLVMTAGWGDWTTPQGRQDLVDLAIKQMQESRARGVQSAMVTIDFLIFDTNYRFRGVSELFQAFDAMKAAGVLDMVVAVYPVDEPEDRGLSTAALMQVNSEIRATMAFYSELSNTKIAVFYTDHGNWPGISTFDWVGADSYGNGPYLPPIGPNQKIMLIPGGGSPWREDPEPFYQKAMSDSRVVAIIPFTWFDHQGPTGIRANGMAPKYRAVGCRITGRCTP